MRRSIEIDAHGGRVEVALDRGEIHAATALAPVCELEYELKGGDTGALVAFGKDGVREHGLWLSTLTKAARGDRLARGETAGPPVKAKPPVLNRGMTGTEIFRAVLRACLDQVLANATEVGEGHRTAESIHQLRVGIRRARTAWRELAPLGPSVVPDWETPLTEAFRALGAYRDRNTVVATLQARLAESGSPEPTLSLDTSRAPDPVEVVRDGAFQCALLDALGLTLPGPSDPSALSPGDALDFVASRLDRLHKQLKRAAKRFETSTPTEQHQARKRLKRLRYLGELASSLYKPERTERYLDRLAPAQDALGAHIDLLVGLRHRPRLRRGRPCAGLVQRRLADGAARRQRPRPPSGARPRRPRPAVLEALAATAGRQSSAWPRKWRRWRRGRPASVISIGRSAVPKSRSHAGGPSSSAPQRRYPADQRRRLDAEVVAQRLQRERLQRPDPALGRREMHLGQLAPEAGGAVAAVAHVDAGETEGDVEADAGS